jgi:hypothetical protein
MRLNKPAGLPATFMTSLTVWFKLFGYLLLICRGNKLAACFNWLITSRLQSVPGEND